MNSSDDRKMDSAHSTLMRMGLLNERGEPEQDVIAVLSRVYAALFYETLRDSFFEDAERILNFLAPLMEARRGMEYGEAFPLICAFTKRCPNLFRRLCKPYPATPLWKALSRRDLSGVCRSFAKRRNNTIPF